MRRVAIVGTGIAGLSAAYALRGTDDLELFEASAVAGGHANTVVVGGHALDTGFLVHNRENYPNLCRIFDELGVMTRTSEMSLSVSCGCGLEWSSRRPWRAGAGLLREVTRFLRTARGAATAGKTLDRFLADEGYSESFRWHYLVPMTAAIWSTAPEQALEMPAAHAIDFLDNHGMLGLRRNRWRVVEGGSRRYVDAILRRIGSPVHLGAPVRAVSRTVSGVELTLADGSRAAFDAVVIATAAPIALALLDDPSPDEQRALGAFRTTANETVLHRDATLLPRRRSNRSSWNYQSPACGIAAATATMTYSLNRLQGLDASDEWCVSLNRTGEIAADRIERVIAYAHPQVTFESIAATPAVLALNGARNTAFAGAWQGSGFHEDGVVAGLRAAAALGGRA